jgi:hydrogenase expression/formation protein HypD
LERARAQGADVRVVYSPLDAVEVAKQETAKTVVFFGVGFETTMPATALAVQQAAAQQVANFSLFCVHKTLPPALRALLADQEVKISGFLLPGHVTTIIGAQAYDFLAAEFNLPGAVAGFEPLDILLGVEALLKQLKTGTARIDNAYGRAVPAAANPKAREILTDVYQPGDAAWRGLGVIPGSGVVMRDKYAAFDARRRYAEVLATVPAVPPTPCRCGDILRGALAPPDCPLFGHSCAPAHPVGPCMVSSEGACAAAFRYERP